MVSFIANMDYCSLYYKQLCRLFISTSWVGYIFFSSYGPQYKIIGGIKHLRGAIIFICLTIQKFRSHISILTSICNIIGFMLALCLGKSPPFFWFIRRNRFQHSMRIFILHLFLLKRKGQEAYFWPHPVFFFFFNFIDKMNIHECNMKILQTRLIFVFNFIDKTLGEALAYHAIYLGISTFPIKILYLKKK